MWLAPARSRMQYSETAARALWFVQPIQQSLAGPARLTVCGGETGR
jgi:hypothetical protein